MKIAYILPSLVNTGPTVVVYNIVKSLKDKVDLIDIYFFDESPSVLKFNCNVYHITKKDIIDFDKYDIIHSHMLRPDLYIYRNRKKIKKAKTITTIHQDTSASFTIDYNRLISFFLTNCWFLIQKKFDGVIAISDQINNKYNKFFLNKITTIYNGCAITDDSYIDEKIKESILTFKEKGHKILGSYAFISKRKGHSQVIEALTLLPDYGFMLFGEGPYLTNLKEQVIRFNLQDRVLFLPYVKSPYSYLKFMDIYVMPSYSEGFGLAMVEAALAKKSIVCSNLPSFHEIFTDREVSFFEVDDTKSLIQSINTAYLKTEKKGELAFIRANSSFTAEIMANNHLKYYDEMVTNHQ